MAGSSIGFLSMVICSSAGTVTKPELSESTANKLCPRRSGQGKPLDWNSTLFSSTGIHWHGTLLKMRVLNTGCDIYLWEGNKRKGVIAVKGSHCCHLCNLLMDGQGREMKTDS
jgi:hypothetical protein